MSLLNRNFFLYPFSRLPCYKHRRHTHIRSNATNTHTVTRIPRRISIYISIADLDVNPSPPWMLIRIFCYLTFPHRFIVECICNFHACVFVCDNLRTYGQWDSYLSLYLILLFSIFSIRLYSTVSTQLILFLCVLVVKSRFIFLFYTLFSFISFFFFLVLICGNIFLPYFCFVLFFFLFLVFLFRLVTRMSTSGVEFVFVSLFVFFCFIRGFYVTVFCIVYQIEIF